MDASWSETGDRYLLKLFRDYVFHQVNADGSPWIDMAHVVQCLNKVCSSVSVLVTVLAAGSTSAGSTSAGSCGVSSQATASLSVELCSRPLMSVQRPATDEFAVQRTGWTGCQLIEARPDIPTLRSTVAVHISNPGRLSLAMPCCCDLGVCVRVCAAERRCLREDLSVVS